MGASHRRHCGNIGFLACRHGVNIARRGRRPRHGRPPVRRGTARPATPTATWRVTVLAEEADAAYDRVGLTGYTEHWDRARLALPGNDYVGDDRVDVATRRAVSPGSTATTKSVVTADGARIDYDALVLATGSYAFVPPVPGHDLPELPRLPHARRPRRDPRRRRARVGRRATCRRCGDRRWAARPRGRQCACAASGCSAHVVEMAPRLMAQQLDEAGGALLARMIDRARASRSTSASAPSAIELVGRPEHACGCTLSDGTSIDAGRGGLRGGCAPA